MSKRTLAASLAAFVLAVAPQTSAGPQPGRSSSAGALPGPARRSWTVGIVRDAGRPKLQLRSDDGLQATCMSLTLNMACHADASPGVRTRGKAFRLVADGDRVRLTGNGLQVSADRVTRAGATLELAGHVQLRYEQQGRRAEIAADRVVVDLATGHVETDLSGGAGVTTPAPPQAPQFPNTQGSTPIRMDLGFPVIHGPCEDPQIFNFWLGFFH